MRLNEVAKLYRNYSSADLVRDVHPNDKMFKTGPDWYFPVGQSGVDCIFAALPLTKLESVKRILDLPCGHGRVARHLRAAFPDAEIHFSEIDKEGADFCAKTFGGKPHYSVPDLTKANVPSGFDVIWIGSLFTHLPRDKVQLWLTYLSERLAPNGILVATFHGYFAAANTNAGASIDMAKLRRSFETTGYGFGAYEPAKSEEYGFSLSRPSCTIDMACSIPGTRIVSYTERGWAQNHDVLALSRDDRLKPFGG
jgi:SAM-dependent methyltransferase